MIVLSGALVLVALVLLVFGAVDRNLPYVYASIGVSLLSLLLLLVGILQRRGELAGDEQDDATTAVTDTSDERVPALVGASQEQDRLDAAQRTAELPLGARAEERPASRRVEPAAASGDEVDHPPVVEPEPEPEADLQDDEDLAAGLDDELGDDEELGDEEGLDDGGSGVTVLVVSGRPRYHLEGCRVLRGKEPQPLDRDDARTHGFSPCGVCKPDADEPAAAVVPPEAEQDGPSFAETIFGGPLFADAPTEDADRGATSALPDRPVQPVLPDVDAAGRSALENREADSSAELRGDDPADAEDQPEEPGLVDDAGRADAASVPSTETSGAPAGLQGDDPADDASLTPERSSAQPAPDGAADPDELPDVVGPSVVAEQDAPEPVIEASVVAGQDASEPVVEAGPSAAAEQDAPEPVVEVEPSVVAEQDAPEPVVEPVAADDVPVGEVAAPEAVVESVEAPAEQAAASGPVRRRRTPATVSSTASVQPGGDAVAETPSRRRSGATATGAEAPVASVRRSAPAKATAAKKAPAKQAPAKKAPDNQASGTKASGSKASGSKASGSKASGSTASGSTASATKVSATKPPAAKAPAMKASAAKASGAGAAARSDETPDAPQSKRPVVRAVRADALRLGAPATGVTTTRVSARAAAPAVSVSVVVVPDRERFHRPDCRFVRGAADATTLPKASATRQGYVACGVCKP